MSDCDKLQPFDVIRFPTDFEGNLDRVPKIFVVAQNVLKVEVLMLFKPTSKTAFYDQEAIRLKGVVEYLAGEIDCFPHRTLIDPQHLTVPYSYIRACHRKGEFEYIGRLPEDFREKMKVAAKYKPEWRKKDRDYFYNWFQ